MEQKDFILREIEKIGAVIKYIMGKYFKEEPEIQELETTELIDKELSDELGINMETILKLQKAEFEEFFNINKGYNIDNIELLADMLYTIGNNESGLKTEHLTKALEFYKFINEKSKTFSFDRQEKIGQIEGLL